MSAMQRRLALPLVLALAAAALWALRPEPAPDRPRPISGAAEALVFWELQRAYPSGVFPNGGLTAAFAQRRAIEARTREGGSVWTPMGPTNQGGRTLAVALNPLRGETVWLGAAGGGLWRSYHAGLDASWERVATGLPITSVSTVAIAPSDTSVIYVGTGEVYRYQDAQGGVVDRPTRGSYGLGILKSEDGGATWTHVLDWGRNQERGVQRIRVNPADPDDVWAATTEGVYRSTDGGGTWVNVHPVIMAMDLILHPTDPDWAIAGHGDQESVGKGIYRTTDGGATWTQLTNGVPDDFIGKIILDIHPTDPDVVYASVGDGIYTSGPTDTHLLRTTDGGDSWTDIAPTDYGSYQGWFAHYVGINPHAPDTVFLAGVNLYRSLDGGFSVGGSAPIHVDHHAIAFHPTNPNIAYFAEDGGIYRTTDGGATYEDLNAGYVSLQFYNGTGHAATDSTIAIGGAQDNGTWLWEGQSDWDKVGFGDGSWAAIDPTDADVQYLSSQFLVISRTLNRWNSSQGVSPSGSSRPTSFIAPYALAPSLPTRLYAGRDVVYRSDNQGSSWTATNGGQPLIDGNPAVGMAVSATDPDVVYVTTAPDRLPGFGGARTSVHVTRDGGATWTDVTGALPDRIFMDVSVDPTDDLTAYVTASGFGSGHVFRTTDGGATWTDITGTLPDCPTSAVTVDPLNTDAVYVGNDVGVFVTRDGGATWESFSAGLPEAVLVADLAVSSVDRTLRVATHGNGMWKRPLDAAPVAIEPGAGAADVVLEAVAPNPVQGAATVAFRLAEPGQVRVSLYDARGRRVAVLAEGARAAGRHTVRLDAGRLAAGSYVVRLEAGGATRARHVTVVR